MAARAFGTATVSFGLVSIPVKIYTSSKPGSHVSFNLLHEECGTRLKQQYICPECDVVVPRDAMAKGYEYAKGKYLKLSPDEIKALEAVSDNSISLSEFVPSNAVDPLYFEKAYYVGPDKGGERAYQLLSQAMRETGLVGLARYAARGKQYVVLVRPYGETGLVMHQLRYQDELRGFEDVPVGDVPAVADSELDLAVQIIEQIATESFDPGKFHDEVKERVLALIESKLGGDEIEVAPPPQRGEIIDLMAALKASLGAAPAAAPAPISASDADGEADAGGDADAAVASAASTTGKAAKGTKSARAARSKSPRRKSAKS